MILSYTYIKLDIDLVFWIYLCANENSKTQNTRPVVFSLILHSLSFTKIEILNKSGFCHHLTSWYFLGNMNVCWQFVRFFKKCPKWIKLHRLLVCRLRRSVSWPLFNIRIKLTYCGYILQSVELLELMFWMNIAIRIKFFFCFMLFNFRFVFPNS